MKHGTNGGYYAGCREQCCRDAHAAARRSVWRKRYVRGVDALYIDATGTRRRIRALQAIGWRLDDLDREARQGHGWMHNLVTQERVHYDTAQRVAEVYERLCMTPGPSQRCRGLALKRGWAPPLAWDCIDTDPAPVGLTPGDEADVDANVVERILAGDNRVRANTAERREVTRRWLESERSLAELGRLTGWKVERYVSREVAT